MPKLKDLLNLEQRKKNIYRRMEKVVSRFYTVDKERIISNLEPSDVDSIAAWMSQNLSWNEAYPVFLQHGFHLLRRHYYLSLPETDDQKFLNRNTELFGIDMNDVVQLELLENVVKHYKQEFSLFPIYEENRKQSEYYLVNGTYMAIDGNVYYSLIRHYQPKRIVEVGSGFSTLLALAAVEKTVAEGGGGSEIICIEPYPSQMLQQVAPRLTELKVAKVQDIPLDFFEQLQAGDFLFIDSTHHISSGNDVWYEYCEILPRLAPGVMVQIHDISLPKHYPKVYFDNHIYWTEQYVLQVFLTYNARAEVLWAGNYMMDKYPENMLESFTPEYNYMRKTFPSSEPTAFWMRMR